MYRTDQKEAEQDEEVPDEVVSQQHSRQEAQSDGKLESGRHHWTDEENTAVKSAFQTAIKKKAIDMQTVKDIIQGHPTTIKSTQAKCLTK